MDWLRAERGWLARLERLGLYLWANHWLGFTAVSFLLRIHFVVAVQAETGQGDLICCQAEGSTDVFSC